MIAMTIFFVYFGCVVAEQQLSSREPRRSY